jgi:hypothetical protein
MARRSFGAVGGALAIFAVAVAVLAWWIVSAGRASKPRAEGLAYINHCATGFKAAQKLALGVQGALPNMTPPVVVSKGPPARIDCPYTARSGEVGLVTLDIACDDPLNEKCQTVVAVVTPDGEGGYRAN